MSDRNRRQYTEAFKREAVKLVTEQGYTISQAARNLDVHRSLLERWRRRFAEEAAPGSLTPAERDELERLRRENRRLRMEREILKKAAAFFAKESS